MFFYIFGRGISKKIVRGIFIFGSMLFINLGKGYEQKNRPGYFWICKDSFFKYLKRAWAKKLD